MANVKSILHKRSNVVENNLPKLPTAELLEVGEIAINFAKGYETLSTKNSNGEIVTFTNDTYWEEKENEILSAITNDIPRLFFDTMGGTLPTSKAEGTLPVKVTYKSSTDNFSCYGTIKVQGNSSAAYAKKNWTLKLYEDLECTIKAYHNFKGWGNQNKFTIKANWIDLSHARNIISARLWGDVVASRDDLDTLPEGLKTAPNYGAIDGFVVKGYFNGIYYGRYDITIPKDEWMTNMDADIDGDVILCGEDYDSACFRAAWGGVNDNGWSDELRDTTTNTVKNQLNTFITFVRNSTDTDFVNNFENYADLTSFIDYYIFHYLICGLDAFGKNLILLSYGGNKYYASSYDMDSTFGLYWNGTRFVSTSYRCQEDYETGVHNTSNLLYDRLSTLFSSEINARYTELRAGALSLENIINRFEEFMNPMPKELVEEDYASTTANGAFTGIPSLTTNNLLQIRNYIANRVIYVDNNIISVPITGLSIIGSDTIEGRTATYTVEYIPSSTTQQGVTWSISSGSEYATINANSGVLTILNGASSSQVTIVATSTYDNTITATKNITVTYASQNPLTALTINGSDTVEGVDATYTVTYTPSDTDETGVTWSIVSGSEYATIGETTGQLVILDGADNSPVTIMATSTVNPSITATKNITVTANAILYTLSNTEFDGTTPINTGVNIWGYENFEIDLTIRCGTQTINQATIMACMDETGSPYQGIVLRHGRTGTNTLLYNLIGNSVLVNNSTQTFNTTNELTYKFVRHGTEFVATYPNGSVFTSTLPTTMSYSGALTLGDAYNYQTNEFLGRTWIGEIIDLTIKELPEEQEVIVLPPGYTRVEYIASTASGGQYIDLGLNMYESSPVNITVDITANAIGSGKDGHNQAVLLGASSEVSPYPGHFIRKNGSNLQCSFDNTTYSLNQKTNIVASLLNYTTTHNVGTTLFCGYAADGTTPLRFMEAQIYNCKLKNNSENWVRNLWPCIQDSTGKTGLYDLVNDVFYSSLGNEDFIYEPMT